MVSLYSFLFKILLILPVFGIINSTLINKYYKTQKVINNIIYTSILLISLYILLIFNAPYNLIVVNISKNMPIVFSLNSINLVFCCFISLIILFLNLIFQNYFAFLNLNDKYSLYNRQISYFYFFCILLVFSHNITFTILLYSLILVSLFFLLTNPDLKDFRKHYSNLFLVAMTTSIALIFLSGLYFIYDDGASLFVFRNIYSVDEISNYWIIFIIFSFILLNLYWFIYTIFKERFYYEDFLPVSIVLLFPFTILNTFLFIKILYYVFYNNFNTFAPYLFYSQFLTALAFIVSCIFAIKHIKNNIKFNIIFCIANFIIFFSQLLFINTEFELIKFYANFLIFILSIIVMILVYSGILFFLLKTDVTDMNIVYKYSKTELNFFMFCLFMPIAVNFISFFDLNFHNFNIFYLVNFSEIVILFFIYIYYVFLSVARKIKPDAKKPNKVLSYDLFRFFTPQIGLLIIFVLLFLLRNLIAKYIILYR